MITQVCNLGTEKFDAMSEYIGRLKGWGNGGIFGNPYHIGIDGDRATVIEKFREYFYKRIEEDDSFREKVDKLEGKRLFCHCSPLPCHGDVIVEYLNGA